MDREIDVASELPHPLPDISATKRDAIVASVSGDCTGQRATCLAPLQQAEEHCTYSIAIDTISLVMANG